MLIEALAETDLGRIRPLLLDLLSQEQAPGPGLTRPQLEEWLPRTHARFQGENHVFAAQEGSRLVGFCWCVLFDPGTGLEGEVAELYVAPQARGGGVARLLLERAVELFSSRRVTFACVWTGADNLAAVRAYRAAGFAPTDQVVLTWYPGR
ncbi:MAG: GNAT family N-acetyltransferase [Candidatus Dormibacteria bacterium]